MKRILQVLVLGAAAILLLPEVRQAPAAAEEVVVGGEMVVLGAWRGAKLLCRKEEGKAVRCGKPEPFDVVFKEDGTGTSADDRFPSEFTYRWDSPTEITVTPLPEGEDLKLFQLELAEGFLTFQAYIYLPLDDPNLPEEVNYIHYIFDVSRVE